jgi:lysozyme
LDAFAFVAETFGRPEVRQQFSAFTDTVFLLGRRGYYRDSMGEKGQNDINIYDDAICLVTPQRCVPYNANTDPSREHKGVALLQPGRWLYRLGIHGLSRPIEQQYGALVQAGSVIVKRSGTENIILGEPTDRWHKDYGYSLGNGLWRGDNFAINIHKGSRTTTSSEGCQTIHPSQWGDFIEKVKATMAFYSLDRIPYILTERA